MKSVCHLGLALVMLMLVGMSAPAAPVDGTGATYGVYGQCTGSTAYGYLGYLRFGIYAWTPEADGIALYGIANSATGATRGIYGRSASNAGTAVYAVTTSATGATRGVDAQCASDSAIGVYGYCYADTGSTKGVYGRVASASGTAVYGQATAASGTTYGVYGKVNSSDGWAGYFEGGKGLYTSGFKMPFGHAAGYALVSDANGVGTWQPVTAAAWGLSGNAGTTPGTNFLGTTDNQALQLHVNGARALRIEPDATSPNLIGGYSGNSVTAGAYAASIGGGGSSGFVNTVTDIYGVVGGGRANQAGDAAGTTVDTPHATVGGGFNNVASGAAATVGGGQGNTASGSVAVIAGGLGNDATSQAATVAGGSDQTASGLNSTIGGGDHNTASGSLSTVSGGASNTASDSYATVGGGYESTASGDSATVAGGMWNVASGGGATVGGGVNSTASGSYTTISGGRLNSASGSYATVGGGYMNEATGGWSTVPGGDYNAADGAFSFAAGRRAKADHDGTFVWGDSTDADFASTAANQFLIRAGGGVGIGLTNPSEALDVSGNIHASGSVSSGSTMTMNGTSNRITSTGSMDFYIAGGRALRLEDQVTSPNVIAGYSGNAATAGVNGSAVSGGGYSANVNKVTDHYCVVGGGVNNVAGDDDGTVDNASYATVGGGRDNEAGSQDAAVLGGYHNRALNTYATIGGGYESTASGNSAAVAGGKWNLASGNYASVAGGYVNTASGQYAAVPGGRDNVAAGIYSMAAGRKAKANHQGAFVWADSTAADFASTAADQFLIRAGGGVGIGKADPGSALDVNGTVTCTGFKLSTGAGVGKVLTSDATGTASWGAPSVTSWVLAGNTGTTPGTDFVGTTDNQALEIKVNSIRALRIEPAATCPNLIGGYSGNNATAGVYGATVGGGGSSSSPNRVTDHRGTVGGGYCNRAGNDTGTTNDASDATVGGGSWNSASGSTSTVAGGSSNAASGDKSSIGGGNLNTASGNSATVAGGYSNQATGGWSTVPGGDYNTASGNFSFAAGRRAKATAQGAFTWADGTNADFTNATQDRFAVRANGGVYLYSNGEASTGVYLSTGSGSWASVSDREAKTGFAAVDGAGVLDKLVAIPITSWSYKSERAVRHISPMAQDLYAAFGLGDSDRTICTIDGIGLSMAAIQGLYQRNRELREQVERRDGEIDSLKERVSALEAALGALGGR